MCGRYALALRPSRVRQMLQDDDLPVDDAPDDDAQGDGAPRQSYNFAPGYHGIVYRADVPDWGAGPRREHGGGNTKDKAKAQGKTGAKTSVVTANGAAEESHNNNEAVEQPDESADAPTSFAAKDVHYKLQSMKWGLIPFWTKRNPDYPSMLKTINCRDDSLAAVGGMWATMKARKRCIVVAQGFYEWLKPAGGGGRGDKIPHYVQRADGRLLCMAGLWDCVRYEDEGDEERKHYTYTIITTASNKQLQFLHDRMPVILDQGSEELRRWLDPERHEWSAELQELLRPYEGALEVYPVSREVGKVGNDSPNFIIPVASRENKNNIANFFAKGREKEEQKGDAEGEERQGKARGENEPEVEVRDTEGKKDIKSVEEVAEDAEDGGMVQSATGIKREAPSSPETKESPAKKPATKLATSPAKPPSPPGKGQKTQGRPKISATSNAARNVAKGKGKGDRSQKITKFFGNSA